MPVSSPYSTPPSSSPAPSAVPSGEPPDGLPAPQRYYSVGIIILGISLCVIDSTIVNLALPLIARDLRASAADSVWVVNAFQLAVLTMLLPMASLGDRIGYRRVYLGGTALFTAASFICMLAPNLPVLCVGRALQGLGAAGVMGVNAALVRLSYPRALLGRGIALNSMVVATSSVAGPTIAAGILSIASWPWLFGINLPLGILVLMGARNLPHNVTSNAVAPRLSPVDVVLNALMFALIFIGVDMLGSRSGAAAKPHAWIMAVSLIAAGLAIGWIYMRRQMKQDSPMFPLDLMRIPVFRLSVFTGIATFAAQSVSFIALPFLFIETLGKTPLEAGLLITCWPLSIVAVASFAGRLIGRVPTGVLGGIGLAVIALGLTLLATLPAHPSQFDIIWRLVVCGLGFGLFQSPNAHAIMTSGPMHRSGAAGGMIGVTRLTGQSIGAVTAAIVFSYASAHTGQGTTMALVLGVGFAALGSLFSFLRLRH